MQALSQLSYSPTKAGTLRAGQNPVKALGSSYYACEIIGLASPARSESGTAPTSDLTMSHRRSSRSFAQIHHSPCRRHRQRSATSSRLKNHSITAAVRTPRAADEALRVLRLEQGKGTQPSRNAYIIAKFCLMETAPFRQYICWYKRV